jgi:ABC-type lipoprotein release transport system permease subunit
VSAVALVARAEIRRHWKSAVYLALLVGIVGAAVIATAAGARRTATSLSRFNAESGSASIRVVAAGATQEQLARFRAKRDVVAVAPFRVYAVVLSLAPNVTVVAPLDQVSATVDRARLLSGRNLNPNSTDEVAVDESFAAATHTHVGDHLDALAYTPAQIAKLAGGAPDAGAPAGAKLRFDVVGIVRRPVDLGRTTTVAIPIWLTPAFDRRYVKTIGSWGEALLVQTKHGAADLTTVSNEARQVFGALPGFSMSSLASQNNGAQSAIDFLAIALWICCAVAALAGVTVISIVLGRELDQNGPDHATLQTLGFTLRQRVATYVPFTLLVGVGGVAVASITAFLLSPLFPIGVARRAEPHLGVSSDWTALALGGVGVLVVVTLVTGISALRATRPAPARPVPNASWLAAAMTRTSLAPTVAGGVGMALQRGRGRATVPLMSAVVGAALGIVGISGALVYRANLDHLVATPRLYGWTWDFKADDAVSNETSCTNQDFGLARVPGVAALEAICYGTANVTVDGRATNGWGVVPIRGTIGFEVTSGRAPETSDEVALGSTTMRALHKRIGDQVTANGPHGGDRYRIVGETLFPELGQEQPLADGAVFTGAGYAPLFDRNNFFRYLVGRYALGADRATVLSRAKAIPQLNAVATATVPVEVSRLQQTNWAPIGIAALVGVLAILALAHAIATTGRRRRRDLAMFKTLGFERRQIRAVVAWQATTLAAMGILVGLPAGLLIGALLWRRIADALGITHSVRYPTSLLLVVPAVLLVVNMLAFFPARAAARARPAVALRGE